MKVLLINGSPNKEGCTYTALCEVAGAIEKNGVETELFQLGREPIQGCTACRSCRELGRCVFDKDAVNRLIDRAREADGFVIGSPVYYAAAAGSLVSALNRAFYAGGSAFRHKPGAAVVSCRRGGAASAFEQLNKYFSISQMPVVSSQYWNMVHGNTPDEVRQDLEGLQTMRTLGNHLAWLLKCIEAGRRAGIAPPEQEPPIRTNFIR